MRILGNGLLAMVLLTTGVAQKTVEKDRQGLTGDWIGIFTLSNKTVPIQLHFQTNAQSVKGTLDVMSGPSGIAVASLQLSQETFSGAFQVEGQTIAVEARLRGNSLVGTTSVGDIKGTLQLIRLLSPDLKQLRAYEGIYKAGRRKFLVEQVGGGFLTFVELPLGIIRGLFAVGQDEFVAGPTLLAAQPEERRLTFRSSGPGIPVRLLIREGKTRISATQIPIRQEDVLFRNADVKLAGTLLIPPSHDPHPAIVFLHGSGDAPRQSYFGLGYLLASQGIAVLKYDKRGSGESTGNLSQFTYEDLADDAVAGAHFLQSRTEIQPSQVGFWGLSEGGWTAPLAASRMPETAFVVAASAGAISPAESELKTTENLLRSDGRFSETEVGEAMAFQRALVRYMKTHEGWEEYFSAQKNAESQRWYQYPATDLWGPKKPASPFWRNKALYYFYDPKPTLGSLRCPFLGLWGAREANEHDVAEVQKALTEGGDHQFTLRVLPNANHDLFLANTARDLSDVQRFSPEFFPLVTEWIQKHCCHSRNH